jgi:hypothetical protein
MPPFEQRRPRFDHGIHCSLSDSFTQFLQHCRLAEPPIPSRHRALHVRIVVPGPRECRRG